MRLSAVFSHTGNPRFWDEAEKAQLLISRLNCNNYANSLTGQLLRKATSCIETPYKYNAIPLCCYLYGAWSALSEQAKNNAEIGYEPEERYLLYLESANDHIFWRVMPYLNTTDFNRVLDLIPVIYSNISRTLITGNLSYTDIDNLLVKKFNEMPPI